MALPWFIYAVLVVLGATEIHVFSKLAKETLDPLIALPVAMFAGFILMVKQ